MHSDLCSCCAAFLVIGYLVAWFMIKKFAYATPGRPGNYTDEENAPAEKKTSDNGIQAMQGPASTTR